MFDEQHCEHFASAYKIYRCMSFVPPGCSDEWGSGGGHILHAICSCYVQLFRMDPREGETVFPVKESYINERASE